MNRLGRRLVFLVLGFLACAFAALTGVKAVLNSFPPVPDVSPCPSAEEARRRGTWVQDVEASPRRVVWRGHEVEVEEAWVEEVAFPDHYLVWFPYYHKVGKKELCLRLAKGQELFPLTFERPIPSFCLEGKPGGFGFGVHHGQPHPFTYGSDDDFSFPLQMGLHAMPLEPVDAYDITLTAKDPAGRVSP
jgi:hypothetical protein